MHEQQLFQIPKLRDRNVGRPCGLETLGIRIVMHDHKSEHATLASTPEMPTPTCAAWIMLTSLAPSPIASKIEFWFFLTSLTTSAFCNGDTRPAARVVSEPSTQQEHDTTYSK